MCTKRLKVNDGVCVHVQVHVHAHWGVNQGIHAERAGKEKCAQWAMGTHVSLAPSVSLQVHLRSARRLCELCCANRGTFIKVGQHLGALDYLLPEEYTSTLKVLHSQAPQSSMKEVRQVIREDLGKEVPASAGRGGSLPVQCVSRKTLQSSWLGPRPWGSNRGGEHGNFQCEIREVRRNLSGPQ